jgi:hypothetical protein
MSTAEFDLQNRALEAIGLRNGDSCASLNRSQSKAASRKTMTVDVG